MWVWLIFVRWSKMNGLSRESNCPFIKSGSNPKLSCDYGHMTNTSDFLPTTPNNLPFCKSFVLALGRMRCFGFWRHGFCVKWLKKNNPDNDRLILLRKQVLDGRRIRLGLVSNRPRFRRLDYAFKRPWTTRSFRNPTFSKREIRFISFRVDTAAIKQIVQDSLWELFVYFTRIDSEIVVDANGGTSVLFCRQKTDRGRNGVIQF